MGLHNPDVHFDFPLLLLLLHLHFSDSLQSLYPQSSHGRLFSPHFSATEIVPLENLIIKSPSVCHSFILTFHSNFPQQCHIAA